MHAGYAAGGDAAAKGAPAGKAATSSSDEVGDYAECAVEQADELVALKEIFADDCEVQSERHGEVAFALYISVDFGARVSAVRVRTRVEEGQGDEAVAKPQGQAPIITGSSASSSSSAPPKAASDGRLVSVVDAAKEKMRAQAAQASGRPTGAPALERSTSGAAEFEVCQVQRLPPLELHVALPASYPAEALPSFHVACLWLGAEQLARLCQEMDERAEDMKGLPVVFTWAEMLRSETVEILRLGDTVTLSVSSETSDLRAMPECMDVRAAIREILEFDEREALDKWMKETHCCGICFADKPGSQFCRLGHCRHTFCKECLGEMCRIFVVEGSITELRCPDPKCRGEIGAPALAELLEEDLYERWERLKLQQILTSEFKGVVFCPRCEEMGRETPVLPEQPSAEGEAPLAQCTACGYMFCGICQQIYHNSTAHCAPPEERAMMAAFRREAAKGLVDQREKHRLQKLARGYVLEVGVDDEGVVVDATGHLAKEWGKGKEGDQVLSVSAPRQGGHKVLWADGEHPLQDLAKALSAKRPLQVRCRVPQASLEERMKSRRMMEELLTLRELARDSQNCPNCHALICRSEGCNHITCANCRTHFCYRCATILNPANPYSHFSADGCPTFDRSEVERMIEEERRGGQRDHGLELLRQQFGDQEALFAQFQAGVRRVRISTAAQPVSTTCDVPTARPPTATTAGRGSSAPFRSTTEVRVPVRSVGGQSRLRLLRRPRLRLLLLLPLLPTALDCIDSASPLLRS
eukprot:TRINITY_DN10681_c0_g1_i2.p1 TRINITY_DN10681_c0_g1~~TRINITY_DN10681_c0_g1_i2.p1  ORF type:complete len:756 (-),score=187.56 TRINITY_DN10681_c0_g1_i2:23-2290(-)